MQLETDGFVQIWQQVKAANPSLSVCEVGANIGRLWREMNETDKQRYNDDFATDKVLQNKFPVLLLKFLNQNNLLLQLHYHAVIHNLTLFLKCFLYVIDVLLFYPNWIIGNYLSTLVCSLHQSDHIFYVFHCFHSG